LTASEFAFLALGLVLGVATGSALVEFLRARPPVAREVRLTVATDAVPRRRAATLADRSFASGMVEAARGGPGDRAHFAWEGARGSSGRDREPIGVPVGSGADPMVDAIQNRKPVMVGASHPNAMGTRTALGGGAMDAGGTVESPLSTTPEMPVGRDGGEADRTAPPAAPAADPGSTGPCAEARRLADERCEVAGRARLTAGEAQDTLRTAQRTYDDLIARSEAAAREADPRTVRAAKEAAQHAFRVARASAGTDEAVEAAARDWLLEINRINTTSREAAATVGRDTEAARAIAVGLEQLAVEADAARIAADAADAACVAARESAADCDEAASAGERPGHPPSWTSDDARTPGDETDEGRAAALGSSGTPTIFRLLRGDRAAMTGIVDQLAGADPIARRRWQIALSDLIDAILALAIESAALDFPEDHPFWSPFTLAQDREIVAALASLGYRFDGLGDWSDGRVPSQRDLSLALGYAGLDPMRMRHWPAEAEMAELFRDVTVAADEYLAGAAGDLTLGELVSALGRRADGLTDVWNAWGRIRPLLLSEG